MMEEALPDLPPKSKFAPRGIDHKKTIALRAKGFTVDQIAAIQKCSHTNIMQALQRYNVSKPESEDYKNYRGDIFAGLQHNLLKEHLSEDKIKRMPVTLVPLWFNSLYNAERLERGQSTENNSIIITELKHIQDSRNSE